MYYSPSESLRYSPPPRSLSPRPYYSGRVSPTRRLSSPLRSSRGYFDDGREYRSADGTVREYISPTYKEYEYHSPDGSEDVFEAVVDEPGLSEHVYERNRKTVQTSYAPSPTYSPRHLDTFANSSPYARDSYLPPSPRFAGSSLGLRDTYSPPSPRLGLDTMRYDSRPPMSTRYSDMPPLASDDMSPRYRSPLANSLDEFPRYSRGLDEPFPSYYNSRMPPPSRFNRSVVDDEVEEVEEYSRTTTTTTYY